MKRTTATWIVITHSLRSKFQTSLQAIYKKRSLTRAIGFMDSHAMQNDLSLAVEFALHARKHPKATNKRGRCPTNSSI